MRNGRKKHTKSKSKNIQRTDLLLRVGVRRSWCKAALASVSNARYQSRFDQNPNYDWIKSRRCAYLEPELSSGVLGNGIIWRSGESNMEIRSRCDVVLLLVFVKLAEVGFSLDSKEFQKNCKFGLGEILFNILLLSLKNRNPACVVWWKHYLDPYWIISYCFKASPFQKRCSKKPFIFSYFRTCFL